MANKIIVDVRQFKRLLEKFQSSLRGSTDNGDLQYWSKDGKFILQYHRKSPPGETNERVNFDLDKDHVEEK